jgi:hypothetical protein
LTGDISLENENPSTIKKIISDEGRLEEASEEVSDDQKKPFSGFMEKLILLVVGFALTTLVGGVLADRFRRENARTELEIAAMQSDIARSIQVFENISQLMDKRLFRMRRLHDVFNGDIGSDALPQRLSDYRNVYIEWNDNLNRYRALYVVSFTSADSQQPLPVVSPGSCSDSFEEIASEFNAAHTALQKLIDKKAAASTQDMKGYLDRLNVCVYSLDERMLASITAKSEAYRKRIAGH